MGVYTFITAVILPIVLNILLNIGIFLHVRNSSLRIQPQTITAVTIGVHRQQPKISRRDIALLKQMLFMFTMFIFGWAPIFLINMISMVQRIPSLIVTIFVYLSALCLLSLIINLLMYNYEIGRVLFNVVRFRFHC